jgi:hypothetical protein
LPFVIFLGFFFLFTIALPILGVRVFVSVIVGRYSVMAGGCALIPKEAFGWPILADLFHARVGSFSSRLSDFHFLVGL